jgi:frataxin-like iron-binding protein CyaY
MRGENGSKVVIAKGAAPSRERWPFSKLKPGEFFQVDNMTQWIALRTAASRAGKRLNRKFSVRKDEHKGKEVIRVYAA